MMLDLLDEGSRGVNLFSVFMGYELTKFAACVLGCVVFLFGRRNNRLPFWYIMMENQFGFQVKNRYI